MKILAIDQATQCGWAYWDGSSKMSGVWNLSIKRDESRGMRLIRLRNKLQEIKEVDVLVFEVSKNHRSKLGAEVAGELRGLITTWCHDNNVEYKGINYLDIKRFATGKGNAKKEAMIAACKDKLNYEPLDDNEADARWLMEYAIEEFGKN